MIRQVDANEDRRVQFTSQILTERFEELARQIELAKLREWKRGVWTGVGIVLGIQLLLFLLQQTGWF